MKPNIRLLYLYLFSFVGLLIVVIGSVNLVSLSLRTFVFKDADRYDIYYTPPSVTTDGDPPVPKVSEEEQRAMQEKDIRRRRQQELTQAFSMIFVGAPLYLYHWKTIQKESSKKL